MSPIAAALTDDEILNLAVFYSSQTAVMNNAMLVQQQVALGAQKAQELSCTQCHQAGLKGNDEIPKLAGQQPDYVSKQLTAFRDKVRIYDGGTMQNIARPLSNEDIINLGQYISSLPPVVPSPAAPPSGSQ